MKTIDRISRIGFFVCTIIILGLLLIPRPIKAQDRDLQYEAYCDSVWRYDRDYYMNVLVETDRYQEYLDKHGEWWEEDCPAYLDMEAKYDELKRANDFKRELIEAQEKCINEAEIIMLRNGICDEYYNRFKFKVDSLCITQL